MVYNTITKQKEMRINMGFKVGDRVKILKVNEEKMSKGYLGVKRISNVILERWAQFQKIRMTIMIAL